MAGGFFASGPPRKSFSSFKWKIRLFIWDFSYFLRKAFTAINFPHTDVFVASNWFWKFCFHFICLDILFWSSLWFHHWLTGLVTCCLVSIHLFFPHFSFYSWFLFIYHCEWKKMHDFCPFKFFEASLVARYMIYLGALAICT